MTFTDDLTALARDAMERWSVPGIAVGTISPERSETWTFGVTALDTQFPIRSDTLFQVGSVSKPFTATLLQILAERGRLELDAPVINYVDDLVLGDRDAREQITSRHLLTHQAGFWGDWFDDCGLGDDAMERFVAEYGRLPQMFEPGTMWAYNNCGYILAGLVATRVTGETFEKSLAEHLLKPLSLDHTVLSAAEAISYPVAVGHTVDPDNGKARIARAFLRPRARNPAGGVLSSIDDILSFTELHLHSNGSVLPKSVAEAMHQPLVDTYEAGTSWGLGFKIEKYGESTIVSHGGATNGFRALLQMATAENFAVAVLTNGDGGSQLSTEIADWILETQLGIAPPELPSVELDRTAMDRLTGVYVQPYGRIDVRRNGDLLEARQTSDSPYSEVDEEQISTWFGMRPIGEGRFVVVEGNLKDAQLKFWEADDGRVRFLQVGGRLHVPDSWDYKTGVDV